MSNLLVGVLPEKTVSIQSGKNSVGWKQAFAQNNSLDVSNVKIYEMSQAEIMRGREQDEFVAVWSGDNLTGIDFSPEDDKRFISFSSDKTRIEANGNEVATITIRLLQNDATTPWSVNVSNKYFKISSSLGNVIEKKVDFVSGVATINFSVPSLLAGFWQIPSLSDKRFENFKILNPLTISAYL